MSDLLRRNLERSFGPGKWGVTVHNFIATAPLQAARMTAGRLDLQRPLRIFIAAKLYPAKGVAPFLDAIAPHLSDAIRIDIAGDGELEAALRSQHSDTRIHFHGWQDSEATLRLAAQAHAIVVPSVWEEPCASTVLEALLLGKTSFALRRGGTPELAAYVSAPEQLRLFDDMDALVAALLAFAPQPDYSLAPQSRADAAHAAAQLLHLYRLPPGPLLC